MNFVSSSSSFRTAESWVSKKERARKEHRFLKKYYWKNNNNNNYRHRYVCHNLTNEAFCMHMCHTYGTMCVWCSFRHRLTASLNWPLARLELSLNSPLMALFKSFRYPSLSLSPFFQYNQIIVHSLKISHIHSEQWKHQLIQLAMLACLVFYISFTR